MNTYHNDEDRIIKKILNFHMELGELYKYWSIDQQSCGEKGWTDYNPLLEKFVDVIHSTVSIGQELEIEVGLLATIYRGNIINQFNEIFKQAAYFSSVLEWEFERIKNQYERLWGLLIGLSEKLGFAQEVVEQAYMQKHHGRKSETSRNMIGDMQHWYTRK